MIFRRPSFSAALLLVALVAACASHVGKRPRLTAPRTEAAIALTAVPPPVSVDVSHIVDGDTFRIFVTLRSGERVSAPVRIRGFDAPELHGRCDGETRAAQESSRALGDLLADSEVLLSEISSDKYARVLARVHVRRNGVTRDVAEEMVSAGYGRAYQGGRRAGWCG